MSLDFAGLASPVQILSEPLFSFILFLQIITLILGWKNSLWLFAAAILQTALWLTREIIEVRGIRRLFHWRLGINGFKKHY